MGSNYVFPQTANEIIKAYASTLGGTVHGEEYADLGDASDATLDPIIANKFGLLVEELSSTRSMAIQMFKCLKS